jgi:AmiR/NasT family two-component response regulator
MDPLKILVCEDERLFALELKERLERMGHRVVGTAGSGGEAVAMAKNLEPDLVLMDIKLSGGVPGTRVADVLQRSFNIPSIFLTAFADHETISQARRSHPLAYLVKPIDDQELELAIEFGMAQHQVEEDLREELDAYSSMLTRLGVGTEEEQERPLPEHAATPTGGMEDLSGVIGSIAHHINNSLAGVMGYLDWLAHCGTLQELEQRYVKLALEGCYEQKLFVQKLLWASQQGPRELGVERIRDVMDRAMEGISKLKKPGVSFDVRSIREDMAVFVDEEALRNAVVGVLLYAQRLIDGQGTITINAESEYINESNLQNPRAVPDSFVIIDIHSGGREMTEEEIRVAHRPADLTDGDAHALGLALAVAHGVSQAHGGWLQLESKAGAGTSFKLFLPRVHTQ